MFVNKEQLAYLLDPLVSLLERKARVPRWLGTILLAGRGLHPDVLGEVAALRPPAGDGWLYEPKWDGFRAIVFRDGDEVLIQSRDLKPLDRYFPELAAPLRASLPERCVLDGEVVIARDGALDFDALLLRIHPAESRVRLLSAESPASFVAWDLLALDGGVAPEGALDDALLVEVDAPEKGTRWIVGPAQPALAELAQS